MTNPVDRARAFIWPANSFGPRIHLAREFIWMVRAGGTHQSGIRKEVMRLKTYLKWFRRFRFQMKFEFEAGFNQDRDS